MTRAWVFGKKQDLLLFTGPVLLAVICNAFMDQTSAQWTNLLLIANYFISLPHVYLTYWHAYGYKATRKQHLTWLVFIPCFFLVINACIFLTMERGILALMLAHFNAWHFLKQQQAWFFLTSGKVSGFMKALSKNAIVGVTTGFFLASLCEGHERTWFFEGDLLVLPAWAYVPFLTWGYVSAASYVASQIYLWRKNKRTNWAAHNTFLVAAATWWIIRLGPATASSGLLTHASHGLPYLFLGYRYMKTKHVGGYLKFAGILAAVYIGAFCGGMLESNWWSFVAEGDLLFVPMVSLLFSLSFTHFAFDMFLWNRNHNPEWVKALEHSQKDAEGTQETPSLAA